MGQSDDKDCFTPSDKLLAFNLFSTGMYTLPPYGMTSKHCKTQSNIQKFTSNDKMAELVGLYSVKKEPENRGQVGQEVWSVGQADEKDCFETSQKRLAHKLMSMRMYTVPAYEVNHKYFRTQNYIQKFTINDKINELIGLSSVKKEPETQGQVCWEGGSVEQSDDNDCFTPSQ